MKIDVVLIHVVPLSAFHGKVGLKRGLTEMHVKMGVFWYFIILFKKVGLKRGLRKILINGHFFNKIYKSIY